MKYVPGLRSKISNKEFVYEEMMKRVATFSKLTTFISMDFQRVKRIPNYVRICDVANHIKVMFHDVTSHSPC